MRYIPVVAAAVLLASPARADWMSGAQLQESCSGGAPVDRAMCLSYVMGVADGLRYLDQPPKVPADATAGQVRDAVARYLADHPDKLTLDGRALVRAAIVDAWPDIQPKVDAPPKRKAPAKTVRKPRRRG